MAHVACNACRFSALCFSGGFDEVYIRLLQERMPSTYVAMMRGTDPIELDVVVQQTITQVVRQFPKTCPEKPAALDPSVDTIDHGWLKEPTVHLNLRGHVYGISLANPAGKVFEVTT